jgi:hypothetical protein
MGQISRQFVKRKAITTVVFSASSEKVHVVFSLVVRVKSLTVMELIASPKGSQSELCSGEKHPARRSELLMIIVKSILSIRSP